MNKLYLYISGKWNNQTKAGSFSFVAVDGKAIHTETDTLANTTMNRAGLIAAIKALAWARLNTPESPVVLVGSNQYVLKTPGWAKNWDEYKKVSNSGLVQEYLFEVEMANDFKVEWLPKTSRDKHMIHASYIAQQALVNLHASIISNT